VNPFELPQEGRRVLDLLADRRDLHLDELAELSSGDRALTTGPHRDQRADLLQAQPEPFGASDECNRASTPRS